MREISPSENVSAESFLKFVPADLKPRVFEIRRQKENGLRSQPSEKLIDKSILLTKSERNGLLNAVAKLVDENLFGRSEMCIQFADLLQRALTNLGLPARSVVGMASYYRDNREIFRWRHAWVRVGKEIIDGNTDSLIENPMIPAILSIAPYWGLVSEIPSDRRLRENHGELLPPDRDVSDIWWPELHDQLRNRYETGIV